MHELTNSLSQKPVKKDQLKIHRVAQGNAKGKAAAAVVVVPATALPAAVCLH